MTVWLKGLICEAFGFISFLLLEFFNAGRGRLTRGCWDACTACQRDNFMTRSVDPVLLRSRPWLPGWFLGSKAHECQVACFEPFYNTIISVHLFLLLVLELPPPRMSS